MEKEPKKSEKTFLVFSPSHLFLRERFWDVLFFGVVFVHFFSLQFFSTTFFFAVYDDDYDFFWLVVPTFAAGSSLLL